MIGKLRMSETSVLYPKLTPRSVSIDHSSGFGGGDQKVSLAAQKSWDLKHIDDFRNLGTLPRLMHISEHGQRQ
jgi:hypothetical protein